MSGHRRKDDDGHGQDQANDEAPFEVGHHVLVVAQAGGCPVTAVRLGGRRARLRMRPAVRFRGHRDGLLGRGLGMVTHVAVHMPMLVQGVLPWSPVATDLPGLPGRIPCRVARKPGTSLRSASPDRPGGPRPCGTRSGAFASHSLSTVWAEVASTRLGAVRGEVRRRRGRGTAWRSWRGSPEGSAVYTVSSATGAPLISRETSSWPALEYAARTRRVDLIAFALAVPVLRPHPVSERLLERRPAHRVAGQRVVVGEAGHEVHERDGRAEFLARAPTRRPAAPRRAEWLSAMASASRSPSELSSSRSGCVSLLRELGDDDAVLAVHDRLERLDELGHPAGRARRCRRRWG